MAHKQSYECLASPILPIISTIIPSFSSSQSSSSSSSPFIHSHLCILLHYPFTFTSIPMGVTRGNQLHPPPSSSSSSSSSSGQQMDELLLLLHHLGQAQLNLLALITSRQPSPLVWCKGQEFPRHDEHFHPSLFIAICERKIYTHSTVWGGRGGEGRSNYEKRGRSSNTFTFGQTLFGRRTRLIL